MADIEVIDAEKRFGSNHVIRKLNLHIKHGEFVVLLGPSGCGKTTTLRALAGLETIDSGEIRIGGRRVDHLPPQQRDTAFVFQLYSLYPHLTVFDNIAFPLRAANVPEANVKEQVNAAAKVLRIEHLLKKRPSALAGGDMQRVTIGRALVRRPEAMLMDEPIGALDAKLREEMRAELRRLHIENDSTTVYVTHDQVEAMSMADKIGIMNDGVLQQYDTPTRVYDHPANLFVAQFVGSPIMNVVDCTVASAATGTSMCLAGMKTPFMLGPRANATLQSNGERGEIALGIRPEAISVSKAPIPGAVTAHVHLIEPMGAYDIVDIAMGASAGATLRARTASQFVRVQGEPIYVALDDARTHLFDKRSGLLLQAGS
ncbi:ABC transporter ATP-binding protein [Variovorax sp. J22R133]|uniref:ABC transporter ATP-binding protein n=1 Tax=Variovorax brevis TaxID=3053503 RepID=UPI002576D8A0|nr:ABC transporter ATP-binding protein [Variovorax sp. J22R133]MDM0115221.1 ABC transporter ATP-binding protein [Variovorax sp. J22R133]